MYSIQRYLSKGLYAAKIMLTTCGMWGVLPALKYWASRSERQPLSIGPVRMLVNGRTFTQKMVDTCMALECAHFRNYTPSRIFAINKTDTVIDIGAHIGSFTVYAASCTSKGKIYAFEPSPRNRQLLEENIRLNNLKNVVVSPKAVAGKQGKVEMRMSDTNSAESGLYVKGGRAITVGAITLNDIFRSQKIKKCDFLKIDCEGAEYGILLSTDKATLMKISRIALEYHDPGHFGIEEEGYSLRNLEEHLKRNGFRTLVEKVNFYQGMLFAWRE